MHVAQNRVKSSSDVVVQQSSTWCAKRRGPRPVRRIRTSLPRGDTAQTAQKEREHGRGEEKRRKREKAKRGRGKECGKAQSVEIAKDVLFFARA
eukprot:1741134-Rhodomonas_salina.7